MNRSRLSRKLEHQTLKSFFFTIIGIIAIVFLLFKFGIPFLAQVSFLISGNKTETLKRNKIDYVAAPFLYSLPNATNSAQTSISGKASKNQIIHLYVNDELIDKTKTKADNTFEFADITLSEGENSIKTKAVAEDKTESEFSDMLTVTLRHKAPTLTIESPSDGQTYTKDENNAQVKGKTDMGTKVTVNGYWAIVDAEGNFSYTLPLSSGENKIKIIAQDEAGNKTEHERKINYSP